MDANIRKPLQHFKKAIEAVYGERLKGVILYGSWARGDATADSDIDLLVILQGEIVPGREIDRMIEIITDINLAYDVLLSVYPVSAQSYAGVNSPLFLNVRREGIPA